MLTLPPTSAGPLSGAERLAVLDRVEEILRLRYRTASLGNFEDPLEEAVYIILSRQTREAGYQKAHRALRRRWRSWRALMNAPVEEVTKVIRPAGFGPTRAVQLQGLLRAVAQTCKDRGIRKLTLDWLQELPDDEVERYLTSLPGMGQKSARCVMHYSLDRKILAVDTHVRRILDRLDLVPDRGEKVKHADYESAVPERLRQSLHVNLIHHGRAYCRSEHPLCKQCPLISFCPRGRASQQPIKGRPVAVELFAGGGGMGEGFARAGFFVPIAVELDRHAAQTYRLNHPGTVVLEADATQITADQLVTLAPVASRPAAIIAGPPCQGYSAAGRRRADDVRNSLYTSVVDLARAMQPRFVAIENVPGMRKVEGHSYSEAVLADLEAAGYHARDYLLRACDYGVPQLRRRLVFLAQHRDSGPAPASPEPSHCPGSYCERRCGAAPGSRCGRPPTRTVLEALQGLPALQAGQDAEYVDLGPGKLPLLNGSTMAHGARVLAKIREIEPGRGPISYRRLHDDLARTIVAGHRALPVHPSLDRTISVREAARIQGFEDTHVFAGPRSRQPLQVANAVPPELGRVIANALLACQEACSGRKQKPNVSEVPKVRGAADLKGARDRRVTAAAPA